MKIVVKAAASVMLLIAVVVLSKYPMWLLNVPNDFAVFGGLLATALMYAGYAFLMRLWWWADIQRAVRGEGDNEKTGV